MRSAVWIPPDDPNPFEILHSAVDDTRAGSYEQALAKFHWFHKNALQHDRGLGAVRLSFALSYWLDLAVAYPLARDAFIRTRDEAELAFRNDPSNFDLFHEVASFNDLLGDGIRTADMFAKVAESDRDTALRHYHIAERYLIAVGRFHACGPFLNPQRRMELAAECYRLSEHHEESRSERDISIPKFARNHYIQNVATLVALLVINDRAEEANKAYNDALEVLNDDDFRTIMDAAMTGHLPVSVR